MRTVINWSGIQMVPRDKNLQAMAEHGYTMQDVMECLLGLEVRHYAQGPTPDRDPTKTPADIWVFGIREDSRGIWIYIKVKIISNRCLCLSFHESEYPMILPYEDLE